jgi:hypothetical protein
MDYSTACCHVLSKINFNGGQTSIRPLGIQKTNYTRRKTETRPYLVESPLLIVSAVRCVQLGCFSAVGALYTGFALAKPLLERAESACRTLCQGLASRVGQHPHTPTPVTALLHPHLQSLKKMIDKQPVFVRLDSTCPSLCRRTRQPPPWILPSLDPHSPLETIRMPLPGDPGLSSRG